MSKNYYSLGLMSGTSMDGVDASIIQSDGKTKYKPILDKYFIYPSNIYRDLTKLRNKIKKTKDLKKLSKQTKLIEKKITLFHVKTVEVILKKFKKRIDFIGFHGQTIFHNAKEKISKQLGDGKLLSKLTKKKVVYDFRQNDLKNNGNGAPLTPIFHKLLKTKFKIKKNIYFINIGGITNYTYIHNGDILEATDVGPGMCLIDELMRKKLNKRYDKSGKLAKSGKINKRLLNKLQKKLKEKTYLTRHAHLKTKSFDTKDFNFPFAKKLSLKDEAATLTEFTATAIMNISMQFEDKIILCGGGRKNKFLVEKLKKKNNLIKFIDDYGVDGDFIESQAFAYLAIRSFLKLPISFPETTGCKNPCTGGVLVKNY